LKKKSAMSPFATLILLLVAASPSPRAWPQAAPAGGDGSAKIPQVQPAPLAPPAQNREVELGVRLDPPLRGELDERRAAELQHSFARTAKSLSRNVVRLSIERATFTATPVQFEVSAFVLGATGQVVTFGGALNQANRVVARFVNIPGARPRRAAVVGVDPDNDVGLLDVGPVDVPDVKFDVSLSGEGEALVLRNAEGMPVNPPAMRDPTSRMVVSMWGVRGEGNPIALGMLDGAVSGGGGTRYFQVSIVRRPEASGGIVARQDGTIVAMLLGPAGFAGASEAPLQPMQALPAAMLQAGVSRVRAKAAGARMAPKLVAAGVKPRAWVGVGASDLAEAEFLRQIDRTGAVVVEEVFEASPALAAGIEPHDLLLAWNGHALNGVEDFSAALAAAEPGAKVELECMRRLERRKVTLTLDAW
jgi:S1-C subfamily serine protease